MIFKKGPLIATVFFLAETGIDLGAIFNKTNQLLFETNSHSMFVTALMDCLNLENGELAYINAGHLAPYIRSGKGKFVERIPEANVPLGTSRNFIYRERKITLDAHDTLFMFSDGVTEAENEKEELYGSDRLQRVLNKHKNDTPEKLLDAVFQSIARFRGRQKQSDDITILPLQYTGYRIQVKPVIENLERIMTFVEKVLNENGYSGKVVEEVCLIIDELFTNICRYAYPDGKKGNVGIFCSVNRQQTLLKLRFTDDGLPFNPLNVPQTDKTLPLEKREKGKLGLFLVTTLCDRLSYAYKNGKNVLTVQKTLNPEKKSAQKAAAQKEENETAAEILSSLTYVQSELTASESESAD